MAQAIAQIASHRLIVFDSGTPENNRICTASSNVVVQSLWVTNKGTLADTGAGSVNMSSGYDFDAANKSFDVNVNGTGNITITLTATTTTPALVAAEINAQLRAASLNNYVTPDTFDRQNPLIEAYVVSTNFIGLRCLRNGDSFVLTEDSALAVLGIAAGNYDSTDVILWNLVKVISGGTIETPAEERDLFTNEPISAREGGVSVAPGTVLTAGEKLYAWVNGDSGTVNNLVCLELAGTSGVA